MANTKIKTILVTQSKPESEKNPWTELSKKHKLKIDFRPFIYIEPVSPQDFRKHRIHIPDFKSVIFNSKNAVDHFFKMAAELRVAVPEDTKYFCISEAIAFYLQKYIIYRKRKVFHGKANISDMMDTIRKYKDEVFLWPCTTIHKREIPECLEKHGIRYFEAEIYKTECSDLSDLAKVNYDLLVFSSPSGITSLFKNFPKFKQNNTRIAAFGSSTAQAVRDANLRLDIEAPLPGIPSMQMAIEQYLKTAKS